MFSNDAMKNMSLIVYPERLKAREGYLLGINLTEFVVVVLDVIEFAAVHTDIKKINDLLGLPVFKDLVRRLIYVATLTQSEIKVLGCVRCSENPDSVSESVQKISQFDIWLNLEYQESEDRLFFR